ncbi:MAG: replication-associated recombination protein A [Lentisphaeria bacterium]|nr:replication-associated recombination protein A [Lentisphaeria bacterium]
MDFFPDYSDEQKPKINKQFQPLAARLRPTNFDEYVGQKHLIAEGKLLRRAIEADRFTSIILYGPPGVGKTSMAELIAKHTESYFSRLSAVTATVKDVRACVEQALARQQLDNRKTILFLDEIHRFNKSQQDVLLPHVENGTLRLIGATTENPFFYIVGPLVSRSQVFQLEPLSEDDISELLTRASLFLSDDLKKKVIVDEDALRFFARACDGDARKVLTAFEVAVLSSSSVADKVHLFLEDAEEALQRKSAHYGDDGHYDTISAFIKSMRGSDPNAAIYWLGRMLQAGEPPEYVARRLMVFASEDIGNADPRALQVTVAATHAVQILGMPEARITLAQATTYCATAPKSNASYMAIDKAISDIQKNKIHPIPKHLRDGHYKGAKELGHGKGYQYPHNHPWHYVSQDYLGVDAEYYKPTGMGYEKQIKERMGYWKQRDEVEDE